jgi:tetratricopeptide (TPR) repeat protein
MVSLSCTRFLASFSLKLRAQRQRSLTASLIVTLLASALAGQTATPTHKSTKPQAPKPKPSPQEVLQQHYDAARTFQLGGDSEHAASEYSAFLVGALNEEANGYFHLGQPDKASHLFQEAIRLSKNDPNVLLDYAQMRFQQGNLTEARTLAEQAAQGAPDSARMHTLLGQILFAQKDYNGAREHLEQAVVATPTFDIGYLLGLDYIRLNDLTRARLVFDDMARGLGETAQIHIFFGHAYGEGEWEALDSAVQEFKKAIAIDPKAPKAHYFLALAYLDRDGESGFAQVVPELQAELRINPDDARSHYLLGYIATKQHDPKTAEVELRRAAELDPRNPDPLIYLGQIYADADRDAEAEAAMRKALSLAGNASTNDFLIGRAHYVLGRVLLKAGKKEEGQQELMASKDIRDKMSRPDQAKDPKDHKDPELASLSQSPETKQPGANAPPPLAPDQQKQLQDYLDSLKPAIADAYNNLGVLQAGKKDFAGATDDFRNAGEWNAALETLDRNWGMAAFYASQYEQAAAPLSRQLEKQPDDVRVRAALGLSYFMTQNFGKAIETLKPIQSQVDVDPGLSYAYAVSILKMGDYNEGIRRLKALGEGSDKSADIHMLLGEAYADQHEYDTALQEYRKSIAIDPNRAQTHYFAGVALIRQGNPKDAVEELRTALKLNPTDTPTKYHLAFALIQIQQKTEAQALLQQVLTQDPNYADAYYELGKLQLEQGDAKAAITSLEAGTKASPDSDYIHYQLAMAYRRDLRSADAEREIKLYQALKNRQRGRDAQQTN